MVTEQQKIRRGGQWIHPQEQYKDRHRFLRKIAGRVWYLLVPFVGIMCANDTYVRPDLEMIKSQKNLDRKGLLEQTDDLRADITGLHSEIVIISAELDTVHLPKIKLHGAILDSLLATRRVYDEQLPITAAEIDSLRLLFESIQTEIGDLSTTFLLRAATLDSLGDTQAALKDSIIVLDDLIVLETDYLYRVRHPKEFRKKEALFTGEGEYPRRDENPIRETGE